MDLNEVDVALKKSYQKKSLSDSASRPCYKHVFKCRSI